MQAGPGPNDPGSSSVPTNPDYASPGGGDLSGMDIHSAPSTTMNPPDQGQVVYGNVYSTRHHSGHHHHQQHQQQHHHQHHQHHNQPHLMGPHNPQHHTSHGAGGHQHQQHHHQQHQHQPQHQHQQHQQQQHQQQHHNQPHSMSSQHHHHHQQQQQHRSHGGSMSAQGSPHAAYSMNIGNPLMSGRSSMGPGPAQRTVMMVYGLQSDQVNCDRLFNLFCLYGNVIRIKFLKTKEGCAMVQMGDAISVERCIGSLNKIMLFGSELQIQFSRQTFLHDVVNIHTLPDGSPSFKDFINNKNNRFKNPEVACKNRILPPSPVLHFFNAPLGVTEDSLIEIFTVNSDCEPEAVKIFTPKSENVKSNSGLLTFRDSAEATSALVLCNHLSLVKPGSPNPYTLRLCFSPPTYVRNTV